MVLVKDFYFLKELEKRRKNIVWRKILWKFEKENKLKRNIYLYWQCCEYLKYPWQIINMWPAILHTNVKCTKLLHVYPITKSSIVTMGTMRCEVAPLILWVLDLFFDELSRIRTRDDNNNEMWPQYVVVTHLTIMRTVSPPASNGERARDAKSAAKRVLMAPR